MNVKSAFELANTLGIFEEGKPKDEPKKRGGPKKVIENPVPKRPRGRPKKVIENPVPKRSRGRPRKNKD